MKKLIKMNIILFLIVYVIPSVQVKEVTEFFTDTIILTIENIKEEVQVEQPSSRASEEPRQEMHISEQGLEVLKRAERL